MAIDDRLPPQCLEAEQGVLGGMLLDNDAIPDVMAILGVDDFYRASHQMFYRHIRAIYDAKGQVDAIALADAMVPCGDFGRAGGDDALAAICNSVPHAANVRMHADIVKQRSTVRALIQAAGKIIERCQAGLETSDDLGNFAEREVFRVTQSASSREAIRVRDVIARALDRIDSRVREPGRRGIWGGFAGLDRVTGWWQPGQLIIVAARPSAGKTAIALSFLASAAQAQRKACVLFSMEMEDVEIGERLLLAGSGLKAESLARKLSRDETAAVGKSREDWYEPALWIDDTPSRSATRIAAVCRRLKARDGLDLAAVDYLQLIEPEDPRANRNEQVATITRSLKKIARELKIPILLLSQLNRQSENRDDKRPLMADLRDSGAIEQDADKVLLLHRPDYYNPSDQPGLCEVNVAKNRSGPTGVVKLRFDRDRQRFSDWDGEIPDELRGLAERTAKPPRPPFAADAPAMPAIYRGPAPAADEYEPRAF